MDAFILCKWYMYKYLCKSMKDVWNNGTNLHVFVSKGINPCLYG